MAVPPTSDLSDKPGLRAMMRARRAAHVRALGADERQAAELSLARHVEALLGGHDRIASYQPISDEIDPRRLEAGGRRIVFPRVHGRDFPLSFHAATVAEMVPGWSNILEPRADAPRVVPTALLIPLLAVDFRGNRLGYGAGHYDRTLAALGPVLKIGVAWEVQVLDHLAAEPWDVPLDWIVTPAGARQCNLGPGL